MKRFTILLFVFQFLCLGTLSAENEFINIFGQLVPLQSLAPGNEDDKPIFVIRRDANAVPTLLSQDGRDLYVYSQTAGTQMHINLYDDADMCVYSQSVTVINGYKKIMLPAYISGEYIVEIKLGVERYAGYVYIE